MIIKAGTYRWNNTIVFNKQLFGRYVEQNINLTVTGPNSEDVSDRTLYTAYVSRVFLSYTDDGVEIICYVDKIFPSITDFTQGSLCIYRDRWYRYWGSQVQFFTVTNDTEVSVEFYICFVQNTTYLPCLPQKFAVMPYPHYANACDVLRKHTETTEPVLSGDLASTIEGVCETCYDKGYDDGLAVGRSEPSSPPWIDTSRMTNFSHFFYQGARLEMIDKLNVENSTNFAFMFYYCTSLTVVPKMDTRNGNFFSNMFCGCGELKTVPAIDVRNMTSAVNMFHGCTGLESLTIKNIPQSIQVGAAMMFGNHLTEDSLLCLLNETRYYTDGKTRTLTVGSTNLAKFTGDYEYVKRVGTILDVDDNEIAELTEGCKLPVVWCASTDEGAMTVTDYMTDKGWAIA